MKTKTAFQPAWVISSPPRMDARIGARVMTTINRDNALALSVRSYRSLTIARVTQASGLPRTPVTRLVNSLQADQFVIASGTTIRLGPALLRLAAAAHLDAATLVRPHLEALSRELHETVDLWIEREASAKLVDEVTSDREVRIVSPAGFQLPLNTTAPGKVFLASLPSGQEHIWRLGRRAA